MASPKTRTPKPTAQPSVSLGEIFAVPLEDGRWTACQVVALDDEGPVVADLQWIGDAPPAREALRGVPLLRVDHHSWSGDYSWQHVSSTPPPGTWRSLGNLPVPALGKCNSHSDWGSVGSQIELQARWDALPDSARRAYKAAPYPSMQEIELDLGATTLVTRAHSSNVHIATGDAKVRWSDLDRLPRLTGIDYAGTDPTVLEYLRARPMIHSFGWTAHGRREIDLRDIPLLEVSTRVDGPLRLLLASTVRTLNLSGDMSLLTVVQPGDGRTLAVYAVGDYVGAFAGLPALRSLSIAGASRVDIAPLAAHPALTHLRIQGDVLEIADPEHLGALRALRVLELFHAYRLDVKRLPYARETWPSLERVAIDGFRKTDAAIWKARFAGVRSFELRGGKTDTYLAANLDNPFRDWTDRSPARARKATSAWRKARAALVEGLSADQQQAVLRAFVDVFNGFDDVDTVDREEIGEAFFALAREAGIAQSTANGWFDAWREF